MVEFILDRCDDGDYSIRGYPATVAYSFRNNRSYGYGVCKAFIKRSIGHRPKTVRVKVSTTWRFGWRRASLVTIPAHINLRGISISGMGDAMGLFETPIKIIEDMQQKGKLGKVFYLKFEEVKS